MTLLFLESIGTTELLLILVAALVLFGPRKLPELSRSLGKGLNEFKRASDEFKRTWEREANLEGHERERKTGEAMLPPDGALAASPSEAVLIGEPAAAAAAVAAEDSQVIARDEAVYAEASAPSQAEVAAESAEAVAPAPQSPHKADWL
ncbi:MAG TPA: twin-arginine translocase TatA/TatE family subunit [Pyrinomonadaceae bacterium]